MMRALVIVLDSVGIGNAPDAAAYGDEGADTLRHILAHVPDLSLPALDSLGLRHLLKEPEGGVVPHDPVAGCYGRMQEKSAGKDTTTGHWELAGVLLDTPFAVFAKFPDKLVSAIEADAGIKFIGNFARSGTTVLEELGAEHLRTGHPILYTSADSVLQIAAHEKVVPVARLYEICRIAREHCDALRIGRVIARPFEGEPGSFTRTPRRHDYSMVPPHTVLNSIAENGFPVHGVGKIVDIYAGSGITQAHRTGSNAEGMKTIEECWHGIADGLVFANLVDFDMLFGHRRDVRGYANALAEFDRWLGAFLTHLDPEDLMIITADHGNDPTFRGTDHTREEVPLLLKHNGEKGPVGVRKTFADVAATLHAFFALREPAPLGTPIISFKRRHARPIRY